MATFSSIPILGSGAHDYAIITVKTGFEAPETAKNMLQRGLTGFYRPRHSALRPRVSLCDNTETCCRPADPKGSVVFLHYC